MTSRKLLLSSLLALSAQAADAAQAAAAPATGSDAHIRAVVGEMLAAKDAQIAELEARVRQLEHSLDAATPTPVPVEQIQTAAAPATLNPAPAEAEAEAEPELGIGGFFSTNAASHNTSDHTFDLGALEVGLEYQHAENYAAAASLVFEDGGADIGVAFLDYHWHDANIPPRGRIFEAQGFHVQAGRFDLPFSFDYQYFAAPDRVSITAPLTTERIQGGGFNGDGVRVYGSRRIVNYAAFWTNSVYEDGGASAGGRVGLAFGRNPFRLHGRDDSAILEFGLSHLSDFDTSQHVRRAVFGADASFALGVFRLESEYASFHDDESMIDIDGIDHGHADEAAWHITLVTDLEPLTAQPLRAFLRYETWRPDGEVVLDPEDYTAYSAEDVKRLVFGVNYAVREYLQLKFEYADSLGTHTDEPDFEHRVGRAQLVVTF